MGLGSLETPSRVWRCWRRALQPAAPKHHGLYTGNIPTVSSFRLTALRQPIGCFGRPSWGDILVRGQGVPTNRDEGARWYEKAAAQGFAGAIAALAALRAIDSTPG